MTAVQAAQSVLKPVYSGYFADPYVWKSRDAYYAIGTGQSEADGATDKAKNVFPMLRSRDFMTWEFIGHALKRPDPSLGNNFWAPAVAESAEKFYLYYSVGHGDKHHQLRVAVSDHPGGPYEDTGTPLIPLTRCTFAIDPHPFQDSDRQWYLFYAQDFLDQDCEARVGTALVAAPLQTMAKLGSEPVTILRARWDWQRFEANRLMYGSRWDWHTLEGPCVWLKHGKYYCFYSGGRWENDTYGVDYATASSVLGPNQDRSVGEGAQVLRSGRTGLIGPGHNTIVTGPNGKDFIVFHAWDQAMTKRQMYLAELDWSHEGPRVLT
jgi:beta-xylosidase